MTFEQFQSNAEQMEAHHRDFIVFWDNTILPIFFEHYPNATEADVARMKQNSFEIYVNDMWMDHHPRSFL